MNKEFIPYEQAVELKQLGFDEPCFGFYHEDKSITYTGVISQNTNSFWLSSPNKIISAPLYQQAFRWFRDKHGLYSVIFPNTSQQVVWCIRWYIDGIQKDIPYVGSYTYEEAELACLKKLIQIVKNK